MSNDTGSTSGGEGGTPRKRRRLSLVADSARKTMVQPDEGTLLGGRYLLQKELGRGGMGVVWQAVDQELEHPVAVKILPPELAGSKRAVADLKREAVLAMKLRHPNIMALYHFADDEDVKFLVLELLEGRTLEARLCEDEILPVDDTCAIAAELAAALDYAHSEGVIHRDVKPDNVFLVSRDGSESVRVMDFGIARQIKDSMSRVSKQDTSGTLLYMSPEQLQGRPSDGRTDVYAMAATLYECLAGHPPFFQGSVAYQIVNVAPEPIPDVPGHVNAALLAGLEKDPERRTPSAGLLAQALAGAPAPTHGDELWMSFPEPEAKPAAAEPPKPEPPKPEPPKPEPPKPEPPKGKPGSASAGLAAAAWAAAAASAGAGKPPTERPTAVTSPPQPPKPEPVKPEPTRAAAPPTVAPKTAPPPQPPTPGPPAPKPPAAAATAPKQTPKPPGCLSQTFSCLGSSLLLIGVFVAVLLGIVYLMDGSGPGRPTPTPSPTWSFKPTTPPRRPTVAPTAPTWRPPDRPVMPPQPPQGPTVDDVMRLSEGGLHGRASDTLEGLSEGAHDPGLWMRVGLKAWEGRDRPTAVRCFERVCSLVPNAPEAAPAFYLRAVVATEDGRVADALDLAERASSLAPGNGDYRALRDKLAARLRPPPPPEPPTRTWTPPATPERRTRCSLTAELLVERGEDVHVKQVYLNLVPADGRPENPEWMRQEARFDRVLPNGLRRYEVSNLLVESGEYRVLVSITVRDAFLKNLARGEVVRELQHLAVPMGRPRVEVSYTAQILDMSELMGGE